MGAAGGHRGHRHRGHGAAHRACLEVRLRHGRGRPADRVWRLDSKILVGTQSQGLYAFDVESTGAPLPLSPGREGVRVTRHPHFTNEQLYKAHVLRFAVLPDAEEPDYLFALTATDGLFSTTPDSLDIWNQE